MSANEYKSEVILSKRTSLTVKGTESISRFDDTMIQIQTCDGKLYVYGKDLQIDDLSKEKGIIHILGLIESIEFDDKKKVGFWGK